MDSDTSTQVLGTYQLLRVINKVGVANVGVAKLRLSPIPHHVLCFERQEVGVTNVWRAWVLPHAVERNEA